MKENKQGKVAYVVQARLNSERVPQKMVRPFAESNLFEIILEKLKRAATIPNEDIYAAVGELELEKIAWGKGVKILERSKESVTNDNDIKKIYEWHTLLPSRYEYVVLISACNPLLTITTIDRFNHQFVFQEEENLFAVIKKHQYYWNKEGKLITPWPEGQTIMNTKAVEPTYEAGHVLYASRIDLIKEGKFMGDFTKENGIKLYVLPEIEAFDIDYEWQFEVGELLYNRGRH